MSNNKKQSLTHGSLKDDSVVFNTSNEVISVKEARKLLGVPYKDWSDNAIMKVIFDMAKLSEALLDWQNSSTKQGRGV